MGLIQIVDSQEKRVVHVVVALKKAAVVLYGGHQWRVGVGVNVEAFRDHVKEIKILEGWRFLCPLLFGCLIKTGGFWSSKRRIQITVLLCVDPLRSNFKCIFTPEGKRFSITTSLIFFAPAWRDRKHLYSPQKSNNFITKRCLYKCIFIGTW